MDPDYSRCVQKCCRASQKGIDLTRDPKVNWCPATQTALSDEEVEKKPQKGSSNHFIGRGGRGTRHLAHHRHHAARNDPRPHRRGGQPEIPALRAFHRQTHRAPNPGIAARSQVIPIVGDDTWTSNLTPAREGDARAYKAHFEIGQRHHLPLLDIMNPNGTERAGRRGIEGPGPFQSAKGSGGTTDVNSVCSARKSPTRTTLRLQPAGLMCPSNRG